MLEADTQPIGNYKSVNRQRLCNVLRHTTGEAQTQEAPKQNGGMMGSLLVVCALREHSLYTYMIRFPSF